MAKTGQRGGDRATQGHAPVAQAHGMLEVVGGAPGRASKCRRWSGDLCAADVLQSTRVLSCSSVSHSAWVSRNGPAQLTAHCISSPSALLVSCPSPITPAW